MCETVKAPIHKNWKSTLPRINNYIASSRFQEVNLVGRLYPEIQPVTLSHWALPGGEGAWQQWTFDQIIQQTFLPANVGDSFGPTWSTHWFKVDYSVPSSWTGEEVRLRWSSNSEAAVWSSTGQILQGLAGGTSNQLRKDYIITLSHKGNTKAQVLYVEMAANKLMTASDGDQIDPENPDMYFTLSQAEICLFKRDIYKLTRDLESLYQLADEKSEDILGHDALFTANEMINMIIANNETGASALADCFFGNGNGVRAHILATMGNCHIDSAWLWPVSETKRKVARTFSTQLKLMDIYPNHFFVASQAQQWDWCKQHFNDLYQRVKAKVVEGRFLPVGTTWVEMDGNIPSGESFIRQFLYGRKFYSQEFGYICKEFWLPDTFGYSAQIPALMTHMGLTRFLTKKLSWNQVNKFPNHSFIWEGIDGSSVLAHFPPGDSYTMNCTAKEILYTESNLRDKGRVSTSSYLFGHGDGGGGPTEDQLERLNRFKDIGGVPKMIHMNPDQLFGELEKDMSNMARWIGELFLEFHNGTYTSQARMKELCRKSEFTFRDSEFLLAAAVATLGLAAAGGLLTQSMTDLEVAWKKVLLNQFHDVLPGSGIERIYVDAVQFYQEATGTATEVWNNSSDALFGSTGPLEWVVMNTLQWPRLEVVDSMAASGKIKLELERNETKASPYTLVSVPSFGYSVFPQVPIVPSSEVTVTPSGNGFILNNGLLTAEISEYGQVISLTVVGDARDAFVAGDKIGNQMQLFDDQPIYWDAWDVMDYHLETEQIMNAQNSGFSVTPVSLIQSEPLVASLEWKLDISASSSVTQIIEMRADTPYLIFDTTVDWHENRKFLKVLFDTNIRSRSANFDIQFGQLERPNHMNTSWDSARYEVCGHKWADLSEPDWGLTVMNDSKYGWMTRDTGMTLSLLRSPKAPDDNCDMRIHSFKYALMPHIGSLAKSEAVRRAYEFNNPLRTVELPSVQTSTNPSWTVGSVDGEGVVLHTIKPADDNSGALILRMFECKGCKSKATINLNLPVIDVNSSSGLEDIGSNVPFTQNGGVTSIEVFLTPFQIMALRVSF